MKHYSLTFASGLMLAALTLGTALACDLDDGFGDQGVAMLPGGAIREILERPDGRIVVCATTGLLQQLQPDGSVDTSFGTDGTAFSNGWSAALQPDGKILTAGFYSVLSDPNADPYTDPVTWQDDAILERFNADGSVDTSFGDAGSVRLTNHRVFEWFTDVAVQADGRIVVAGGYGGDLLLARYEADGAPDKTFGKNGRVTYGGNGMRTWDGTVEAVVALDADGRVVVGGASPGDGELDTALARFLPDGDVDTTFGQDGLVVTDAGGWPAVDYVRALEALEDGRVVALSGSGFTLLGFQEDGTPDLAFGTDGIARFEPGGRLISLSMDRQVDGSFLLVGRWDDGGRVESALARFFADGMLDADLGVGGLLTNDFGGLGSGSVFYGTRALADGSVLAAGFVFGPPYAAAVVVRYTGCADAPPPPPPEPVTLAADDFESQDLSGGTGAWTAGWTSSGDVVLRVNHDKPHSGIAHVRLEGEAARLERSLDLSGSAGVQLRLWAKVSSFEATDRAYVRVSKDGVSYSTVHTFTHADSDGAYHEVLVDLSSYATSADFRVVFEVVAGDAHDRLFIDDVTFSGN